MENNNKTQVIINAEKIESGVYDQVKLVSSSPAFKGLISIMPDTHVGKGCVIGFTGKFDNVVIPNIIGVDIGCGVNAYPLNVTELSLDWKEVDMRIRDVVPLGFKKREKVSKFITPEDILTIQDIERFNVENKVIYRDTSYQLGTLGGGNHFIEIGKSDVDGKLWLLIHSGSRNIGNQIAQTYQNLAKEFCKVSKIKTDRDLEYLPLEYGGNRYLHYMKLAQKFASINRRIMIEHILEVLEISFNGGSMIESIHNFIGEDNIIRKGAIQAFKGQQVIIPFNMADGSILGIGKGNSKYNNSAPHGAGRVSSRSKIKQQLVDGVVSMEQFQERMEGVFSTCIDAKRIDESPMSYKPVEDIMKHLEETVEIKQRLKPVYNLKG